MKIKCTSCSTYCKKCVHYFYVRWFKQRLYLAVILYHYSFGGLCNVYMLHLLADSPCCSLLLTFIYSPTH